MEYQKLINDFKNLRMLNRGYKPSLLDIAKFPHRENVISNIISFYLDPDECHNLYDLVLKSLLHCINIEEDFIIDKNIQIYREYPSKGKRIDLVFISGDFVLGIENKINAGLYNDLKFYSKTLKDLSGKNKICIKLVLSPRKENVSDGFQSITYKELFNNIQKFLPDYQHYADAKYLIYLLDLIQTIQKPKSMHTKELYSFFNQENYEVANKIYHHKIEFENLIKVEFWEKLLEKLSQKFKNTNWNNVDLSDVKSEWANLFIKNKNSWITIHIEARNLINDTPYYGFSISKEMLIKMKIDEKTIQQKVETILHEKSNKSGGWIWLKPLPYNFANNKFIVKILPENRDIIIDEIINKLSKLSQVLNDEIIPLIEK